MSQEAQQSDPLTSGPDLIELSVGDPPSTGVIGSALSITDTVENIGTSGAGSSVTRYFFSVDGINVFGSSLLGSRTVSALLATGSTDMGTASLTIPLGTAEGTYHVLACADKTNLVIEMNENNNCTASSGTIAVVGPDLTEGNVSESPSSLDSAANLDITDTLINLNATAAGDSTTRFYFSTDAVLSSNDGFVRACVNGGITPGREVVSVGGLSSDSGTTTAALCVRDALGLHHVVPGMYYVIACADQLQTVGETNEKNNCAVSAGTFTVTASCGNGVLDPGEACDDGNLNNGDGCSSTCTIPMLTSITVTPVNPSVVKGLTQQFTATGNFSDGSTVDETNSATWSSSDGTVASISATGFASALNVGTTTIGATLGAFSDSTTMTVTPATLTSITISPIDPSVAKGLTQQFTATGHFTDNSTVDETNSATWSSTNAAAATISTTGLATAVDLGTSTIGASFGGFSASTTMTVTAAVVVDLSVTPQGPTIAKLTTQQFQAVAIYSDSTTQDVTTSASWTSSDTSIATINSAGLATGISGGSGGANSSAPTTITATYSGKSDTSILTVTNATVTSIAVTPANASLPKTTTLQYTATGTFSDGGTQDITSVATWSSSDTTVASIGATTGLATGIKAGTISISAVFSGVTGSTSLTVTNAVLQSITVTPANPSVAKGFGLQFTATGHYNVGPDQNITAQVTWTSSSTSVATIGAGGFAKAVNAGTSTITATLGPKSGSTVLTGTNATLMSIAITPNPVSIVHGTTTQLTATGTFSNGTTLDITSQVSWTSSSKKTVSVNATGRIKGSKAGTATIRAVKNGITGSDVVTVT